MNREHHFVENGHDRARAAIEPVVRAAVVAEFAIRWEQATFLERLRLRIEINREVERRIQQAAPWDALY